MVAGDGRTDGECVLADGGTARFVRAERSGGAEGRGAHLGRVYVISIVASDACGNVTLPTPIGSVAIRHDRSSHDLTCVP